MKPNLLGFNEVWALKLGKTFKGDDVKGGRTKGHKLEHKKHQIISQTPTHHIVRKKSEWQDNKGGVEYHAVNKRTGKSDMVLDGKEKKHKNGSRTLKINQLTGRKGGEMKAHELYHHLIKHHKMILHAGEQSEGGMKVWQRLHKHKDINIHGWNSGKKKDTIGAKPRPKGPVDVRRVGHGFTHATAEKPHTAAMSLVAHKK
jgi:hypothetical protein